MRSHADIDSWQIVGMPFGRNGSPEWAKKLAKLTGAWLHYQGIQQPWWADDLLILGHSLEEAEQRTAQLTQTLTDF